MPALSNGKQERFYVYAVRVAKRTRYVGKGCGNRARIHLTRSHNEVLAAEVDAARATGHPVRVRIIRSGLSEAEALRVERRMIAKWSPRLVNVSMGSHTGMERVAMAARANLKTLKTEDQVIQEGDRMGVSVRERLGYLRQARQSLQRYAEAA